MKRSFMLVFLMVLIVAASGFAATPKDTLVIAANTGIFITMDPAVAYEVFPNKIVAALYAQLVKLEAIDGVIVPVPDIAESWEISEDGLTYTFNIRKGVKFSNGDPLTAEDVLFSLKRPIILESVSAWFLVDIFGINKDNVDEKIKQIDDYNVSITLNAPYAENITLGILSNMFTGIVNKDVVLEHEVDGDLGGAWLTDHSAGAGPYVLVQWERNNVILLEANPHYYGEQPPLKRIMVRDIPEASNQRLLLERGDIDVAWDLTPQLLEEAKRNPDVVEVKVPGHSNEYLAMNATWGPLANPKVREAVRFSINYEEIVEDIMLNNALLVQGFINKGYFGYVEENPFYQDIEKAKALLAEAGYPDGFEVELLTSNTDTRKAEAEKIQADLALSGIKANIVIMQSSQMYAKYRAQGHQMIIAGWGNDYPDPDNLAMAHASYRANQLAWRNAWFDDYAATLCEWGQIEPNPDKREQIYKDLTEYWFHNGPFAMLYQTVEFWGIRKEVKNFEEAAFGYGMLFDFTKVSK
ncbi:MULTISPECIES: ABC transporter substrate-binding protein [unclassified Mesotoga]|uniref:ABC transporter substrate-binding protein n=1 Tax=unclassified Mesotoga TaxID=1184398 RepID=UPI000DA64C89|nr:MULTISPECIES: ABC transporter substrate-binding protein [unclassified Mesotoga]PZC52071.1 ABC transporter substrate-binding protein [Mesotoga sp. TolDC]